ncbi:MAG: glutaredoxin family protein [Myxococcota bacterium]|nr:glutaredoxin family protein [Myxococcota bacterium]
MRTAVVLVLLVALGGAGVWLLRAQGLAPSALLAQMAGPDGDAAAPASAGDGAAAPQAGAPQHAPGTGAGSAGVAMPSAADEARAYYQYVDASGAVRFVERLEDVPADQRASAGRIEMEARPRRAAPAGRDRDGPRPFARVASAPTVVVYTTTWCGWCRKTLAWLDRRGVSYVNKDIEADPDHREELVRKAGRASIPVVAIDGALVRGYDPERMASLLGS